MASENLSRIRSNEILPSEAMLATGAQTQRRTSTCRSIAEEKEEEKGGTSDLSDDGRGDITEEEWTYPDGGFRAWLVVLGCFMMACSCMGWGLVWGVVQDYYHTNMFPETSLSVLSLAGGLMNFTMTISAFISGRLGDRYGYKKLIALSCLLTYCCLLGSAFTTKLYHVFIFQGFLLGFSQGIAMPLYMSLPAQWFLKKRGLASGIALAGSGIGAAVGSLIFRALLTGLGYKKAMLVYCHIQAINLTVSWFMMKERRPPSTHHSITNKKRGWLPCRINGQFLSVASSVFVGIFGYLPPYYFSTTYTKQMVPSLDPKSLLVVVPLVVMNFAGGIGRIIAGRLADRFGPLNMFFASFFFGGLFQMAIWTFAKSYAVILVFSILYGLIGCWFLSLLPVVCARIFGMEGLASITGVMVLANSPGQFAGPSIAGAILSAASGDWKVVALYSGAIMLLGSACILYARFSLDKRLWAIV